MTDSEAVCERILKIAQKADAEKNKLTFEDLTNILKQLDADFTADDVSKMFQDLATVDLKTWLKFTLSRDPDLQSAADKTTEIMELTDAASSEAFAISRFFFMPRSPAWHP